MNVEELINRLKKFDLNMKVRIKPRGILVPTEPISEVEVSPHPCPRICVLLEGN